jgi:hypothetical protein
MQEINKYQNGKIYQIVSFSHPKLVYYGSTIQPLSVRMAMHRRNIKRGDNTSKFIICFDDAKILLVENFPCNSKEELTKQEAYYLRKFKCVNKVIPDRTKKEYHIMYIKNNQEKIKEYINNNKERATRLATQIIRCNCGSILQKGNISQHQKTKKHLKLINDINNKLIV